MQPNTLTVTSIDGHAILCYASPNENHHTQWKIVITKEMVVPLIKWYHSILVHRGCKQTRMTLQPRYYHPDIRCHVDKFHCDSCQCIKIPCKGMGLLPECDLTNTPLYEVAIDLIGPWSVKTKLLNSEFYALTFIDTMTNLFEITLIDFKSSDAIARNFEQTLLAQYPRPLLSSMTMVASLQVLPFCIFFASWISKTFPQQAKILNQMKYVNVCIKPWQSC